MNKRTLLLAAGAFPENYWRRVVTAAWEACVMANLEDGATVCDFPAHGITRAFPAGGPDTFVSRACWQNFDRDQEYYGSLIRPGDTIYVFAHGADAVHRERVDVLDALCTDLGTPLHVRLF